MDLIVRSEHDKQPKINGKKLDKKTLVFQDKKEAQKIATHRQSYIFEVGLVKSVKNELNKIVKIEEFYGYAVAN